MSEKEEYKITDNGGFHGTAEGNAAEASVRENTTGGDAENSDNAEAMARISLPETLKPTMPQGLPIMVTQTIILGQRLMLPIMPRVRLIVWCFARRVW